MGYGSYCDDQRDASCLCFVSGVIPLLAEILPPGALGLAAVRKFANRVGVRDKPFH